MTDIGQYLRNNKPEMPEEGQFLIETNARLSHVEGIKNSVEAGRHRSQIALIIAWASGLVLGSLAMLLVLFCPLPDIEATAGALSGFVASLPEYKELLVAVIAICTGALGVIIVTRERGAL